MTLASQNLPKTPSEIEKCRLKINVKTEGEKIRQNERQERPRPSPGGLRLTAVPGFRSLGGLLNSFYSPFGDLTARTPASKLASIICNFQNSYRCLENCRLRDGNKLGRRISIIFCFLTLKKFKKYATKLLRIKFSTSRVCE